jgi:epoxyqueuosine reductase
MPTSTSDTPKARIKQMARISGFEACHIGSAAAPWQAGHQLQAFVAAGHHGTMTWMETTLERRSHPTAMWSEAKSAIMLGLNYGPDRNPLSALDERAAGTISVYAQGDDYHDVVKKKLKALAGDIHRSLGYEVKVFVDTAPLMEKPLAARAGLGWQGKHTNLVSRVHGSWLFLGCVLVDAELEPDAPETDHCGTCTQCVDICPTNAFPAPYQLDARRCISYLTIEHAGPIPLEFRKAMGNRIYGCDDCLAVCPWNKFAQVASDVKLQPRPGLQSVPLAELARLDDQSFRALFAKNPIKRIGVVRFLRNVAVAIGNSRSADLISAAQDLATHEAALVRGAAVWALAQLLPEIDFKAARDKALGTETDLDVIAEWNGVL